MLLIGKPSISMAYLYHGELLVITRLDKSFRERPGQLFCSDKSEFNWLNGVQSGATVQIPSYEWT